MEVVGWVGVWCWWQVIYDGWCSGSAMVPRLCWLTVLTPLVMTVARLRRLEWFVRRLGRRMN